MQTLVRWSALVSSWQQMKLEIWCEWAHPYKTIAKFIVHSIYAMLYMYCQALPIYIHFALCCFCCLLICSKLTFSKNSFNNTIWTSNSLDPDQTRQFVGPDLRTNCLQRLSADNKICHWWVLRVSILLTYLSVLKTSTQTFFFSCRKTRCCSCGRLYSVACQVVNTGTEVDHCRKWISEAWTL